MRASTSSSLLSSLLSSSSSSSMLLLLLLLSVCLPSLFPLLSALPIPSADPNLSLLLWSTTTNSTVGSSAVPTSPYVVLSIPITVPTSRSFLAFTNAANLTVTLTIDDHPYPQLIAPSESAFLAIDNSSLSSTRSYSVSHANRILAFGSLSSLCVDCVGRLTLTSRNTTELTVDQPTYALEYIDRDDQSLILTSDYVSPIYPARVASEGEAAAAAGGPSFVLNFTFTLPISSFNFYPKAVLRQLPASAVESRHPPSSHEKGPLAPALLHIPYYFTDIILPSRSVFASGEVLTVKGGFSTAEFDLYCCKLFNSMVTFYSSCQRANASDTFYCVVPPAVSMRGFDGEELTVVATYDPKPGSQMHGYSMRHLEPTGDDNDNTFTVNKPPRTRPWYSVRSWEMQATIVGGGLTLIIVALLVSAWTWRRIKERRQRRAMEQRAAAAAAQEEGVDADHAIDIAVDISPDQQRPYGAFSPAEWPAPSPVSSALSLNHPPLPALMTSIPIAHKKKRGGKGSRAIGGLQHLSQPLVTAISV